MSKKFSTISFMKNVLKNPAKSLILEYEEQSSPYSYYGLLEDEKGSHKPVPLANILERFLMKKVFKNHHDQLRVRGETFVFHCPVCDAESYFTFRNSRCDACGSYFDENLREIEDFDPDYDDYEDY